MSKNAFLQALWLQGTLINTAQYAARCTGVNWLLGKLQQQQNVILGDEMGLGKTIQVLALTGITSPLLKCKALQQRST